MAVRPSRAARRPRRARGMGGGVETRKGRGGAAAVANGRRRRGVGVLEGRRGMQLRGGGL
uniref:Uncharacterized protein n=1 Tax=Oryza sativa subsp. japonica TaxID=39947 RepID=Q6YW79_ORYSJ|nr:hypothetical protein [Oryza sativa Japonica Group]BAD05810.1 hypothetical protein [Oryza sativa Japonica Group]